MFRQTLFTLAVGVFNSLEGNHHAAEAVQLQRRLEVSKVGVGKVGIGKVGVGKVGVQVQRVQLHKKGLFKKMKQGFTSLKNNVANSRLGKAVGRMKKTVANSSVGKAVGSVKKGIGNALSRGKKMVSKRFKSWRNKYTVLLGKGSAKAWVTLDDLHQKVVKTHAEVRRLSQAAVRDSTRSEDIKDIETAIERPKGNILFSVLKDNNLIIYEVIAKHQLEHERRILAKGSANSKKLKTLEDGIKAFTEHEAHAWGKIKSLCDEMRDMVKQTGKNPAWPELQSTVEFVCSQLLGQMETVNKTHGVVVPAAAASAVAAPVTATTPAANASTPVAPVAEKQQKPVDDMTDAGDQNVLDDQDDLDDDWD